MAKKSGLGKGLSALLQENETAQGAPISLAITEIVPNREQPRKQFDEEALSELADSIAQHGVLQPLLVRPMTDGTYQLVAGERRWRASRMAGLTEVPVVIREMDEQEAAAIALIENLQREDLNPIEEARGFRSLMETYGMTQEETAKVVNKSRPAITNAIRLLSLPASVEEMVADGRLSAGHARAVLSFDTEAEQEAAATAAVRDQLSVRALEKLARASHTASGGGRVSVKKREPFYDEVELALNAQLGRRVKVIEASKGGVLQLEFYDKDDLRALASAIAPEV